jgi:hypothetical protein
MLQVLIVAQSTQVHRKKQRHCIYLLVSYVLHMRM